MPSIQSITEQSLVDAISAAKQRVVYVAPGIWPEVAHALSDSWHRLGAEQVSVILDIDAEICRFGYGSIKGLNILQNTAQSVNQAIGHEPGIRICIVIADEQTFIFSPTPRLIECAPGTAQESERSPKQSVTAPQANGIILAAPPTSIERDLGATPELEAERTIGNEAVDHQKVGKVTKDLQQNPPKKFDLARAVNVYNAAIQFAEFKVTGCRLSGHKASLPKALIKVARKNPDLDKKIDKSLHLIEDDDELINDETLSQDTIFAERKRIEDAYLVHVKGGTIIDRKKKDEFNNELVKFKKLITKFSTLVSESLNDRYLATAEQLAAELLPDVLNDLPKTWVRKLGSSPNPDEVKYSIKYALLESFGDPDRRVNAMKADIVFKDVTYDMLKEPEFIKVISEKFPGLEHVVEYTAAKQSSKKSGDLFT